MKLTISKGLLLSLLASMAVQAEPFIAQEIIPVDADTALTVEWKQTLEQQRTELENTEIIGLVRSIRATPEELAELLRSMKSKGVSSYD